MEYIQKLINGFSRYIGVFIEQPPFRKYGQLEYHVRTISLRRKLGSAEVAISNEDFIESLYNTLQAWGIGSRRSKLVSKHDFAARLREKKTELIALDGIAVDDPMLDITQIGHSLWQIIETLDIVKNKSKIVAGTKALHHILPDLVVPIDRAWTQRFFHWNNHKFQYRLKDCFKEAFLAFVEIARKVNPQQFVSSGWNSSRTKVIDNAIIGMLIDIELHVSKQILRRDVCALYHSSSQIKLL